MAHTQLSLVLRHIRKLAGGSKATDRQLLHRFVTQHEEAAFELLVERHGPAVLDLCRRILRHEHDAEDVFQATFLALARKASSIRKPDSLGCWLYGVASRLAFKVRASRKKALVLRKTVTPSTGQEICAALDEELNRLPGRYQAPIILCYLEGKTREEAARQLGWSLGTLKLRLSQGREILRQRLTRRGLTLSAEELRKIQSEDPKMSPPLGLLAFSPDGGILAVSGPRQVQLLQMPTGKMLRRLPCDKRFAFSPDRKVLITRGEDGLAHQWTLPTGRELNAFGEPDGAIPYAPFALSPEGKTLVRADKNGRVRLWQVATGKELRQLDGHEGAVTCVSFSPDGKTLLTGSEDGTILVWNFDKLAGA